jgi:hypothetical protein
MLWPHFTSCHSVAVSQLHSDTVGHLDEASRSRSTWAGASQDIRPGDIVIQVPVSCSASCNQDGQLLRSLAMGLTTCTQLVCGSRTNTSGDESDRRPNNRAPKSCAGQVDSAHLVRCQVNAWSTPGHAGQAAPLLLFGSVAACQPGIVAGMGTAVPESAPTAGTSARAWISFRLDQGLRGKCAEMWLEQTVKRRDSALMVGSWTDARLSLPQLLDIAQGLGRLSCPCGS